MKCQCESCKKIFTVDDKHAGKNANCPNCLAAITIKEYIEMEEIKFTPIEEQKQGIYEDVVILTETNSTANQRNPWNCFWHNVTKNYCNFEGRVGRREYWFFQLFSFIATMIAVLITIEAGGVGGALVALAIFLPNLGISIRRFHDIDLPTIIPVIITSIQLLIYIQNEIFFGIGTIAMIIELIFACQKGEAGTNRYGEPPQA